MIPKEEYKIYEWKRRILHQQKSCSFRDSILNMEAEKSRDNLKK